jgi:hypothetical protein
MRPYFLGLLLAIIFSTPVLSQDFNIRRSACDIEQEMASRARERLPNSLLKDFHDVLMVNELANGCGSLQFTDANMASGTNGFSFGLSQFDLATRPGPSWRTLQAIIDCSAEAGVVPTISDKDYQFLQVNAQSATATLKADVEKWSRFVDMRPAIEAALQSQCGQRYIEDSYIAEMRSLERQIAGWWRALVGSNAMMEENEHFLMLYELDLQNVYGGTEGFRKIVAGEAAFTCGRLCAAGLVPVYTLEGPTTISDYLRYVFTTNCYGYVPQQTRQQDALRRLDTVLGKVDVDALFLDEDDKRYLSDDFASLVALNKERFPRSPDANLARLIAAAGEPTTATPSHELMSPEALAAAVTACKGYIDKMAKIVSVTKGIVRRKDIMPSMESPERPDRPDYPPPEQDDREMIPIESGAPPSDSSALTAQIELDDGRSVEIGRNEFDDWEVDYYDSEGNLEKTDIYGMDHTLEELIAMFDGLSSGSSDEGNDEDGDYDSDEEGDDGESEEYEDGDYADGGYDGGDGPDSTGKRPRPRSECSVARHTPTN